MNLKIVYIDDERVNLSNFELTFEGEFEIATFLGPKEALGWIDANPDVAIVIADQRMGAGTGLQVLGEVSQKVPQAICILVNSYVITKEIQTAVENGLIFRCIQKPWNVDDFMFTIRQARKNYLLIRENEALRLELMQAKGALLTAKEGSGQKDCAHGKSDATPRQAKRLGEVVPICASCKKIRNEYGVWDHVETYIEKYSGAHCSHGICPDCVDLVYSDVVVLRPAEAAVQPGKG